jgi:ankyrin repeat protein
MALRTWSEPNATLKTKWYATPMSDAVIKSSLDIIHIFFQHSGSLDQGKLLHYAVQRNSSDRIQVVNLILSKSPPIDDVLFQRNPGLYSMCQAFGLGTPIYYVARAGHLDVVKLLVENGADPHIVNSCGELPVDAANAHGHLDTVSYIHSLPKSKEPKSAHFVDSHQWKDFLLHSELKAAESGDFKNIEEYRSYRDNQLRL